MILLRPSLVRALDQTCGPWHPGHTRSAWIAQAIEERLRGDQPESR